MDSKPTQLLFSSIPNVSPSLLRLPEGISQSPPSTSPLATSPSLRLFAKISEHFKGVLNKIGFCFARKGLYFTGILISTGDLSRFEFRFEAGTKVSATSRKTNTTSHQVFGVLTKGDTQVVTSLL